MIHLNFYKGKENSLFYTIKQHIELLAKIWNTVKDLKPTSKYKTLQIPTGGLK